MMNPTRHFEIINGLVFLKMIQGTIAAMFGLAIPFVATLGWIAIGQNGLSSLWLYGQVF